jgi:glycine hydroxymethyltransferase
MANITCNKNGIPFDPLPPAVTSGVRVGSPAATTRGFGVKEFVLVGDYIAEVLDGLAKAGENGDNSVVEQDVKKRVIELCSKFPIYGQKG